MSHEVATNTSASTAPSDYSRYYDGNDHKTDGGNSEAHYTSTHVSSQIPPTGVAAPAAGASATYQLWIQQYSYHFYDGTAGNLYIRQYDRTRLNVTMVNKSALRNIYRTASSLAVDYTGTGPSYSNYSTFLTKLEAAGTVLGNPTASASDISTATTNLTSAYNSLNGQLSPITGAFHPVSITFYVPELIYLKPNTTNSTTMSSMNSMSAFQYYVDRATSSNSFSLRTGENTTGNIYFSCSQATKVKSISCSGATPVLSASSSNNGTLECTINSGTMATAVTHNSQATLTWTVTYTVGGVDYTAKSYTRVYAPYSWAVASAYSNRDKRGKEAATGGCLWVTGVHSYSENDNGRDANGAVSPLRYKEMTPFSVTAFTPRPVSAAWAAPTQNVNAVSTTNRNFLMGSIFEMG